jgi:hypothetical protein
MIAVIGPGTVALDRAIVRRLGWSSDQG